MSRVAVWRDGDRSPRRREIAPMCQPDTPGAIAFIDAAGPATCPFGRAEMLTLFHARKTGRPWLSGAAA